MASRLAYLNPATEIAWQKQIRDRYLSDGVPDGADLSLKNSIVRPISRVLAKQVILKYEWLGTLPSGLTHYYGIFFGLYCAGVTCIGIGAGGANINAGLEFGLAQFEYAYLARGANVHWSPPNANSRLVSLTCKMLARQTSAQLIIAYSDTDAGEIGTIYQACNWVCVGRGSSTRQWVSPVGRVMDQKAPYNLSKKHGGTRAYWADRLRDEGWTEQQSNPKYRYVYVLNPRNHKLVDLVNSKSVDYPKRANQHADG